MLILSVANSPIFHGTFLPDIPELGITIRALGRCSRGSRSVVLRGDGTACFQREGTGTLSGSLGDSAMSALVLGAQDQGAAQDRRWT